MPLLSPDDSLDVRPESIPSASTVIKKTRRMLDLVLEDPYRPCGVGDDFDLSDRPADLLKALRTVRTVDD